MLQRPNYFEPSPVYFRQTAWPSGCNGSLKPICASKLHFLLQYYVFSHSREKLDALHREQRKANPALKNNYSDFYCHVLNLAADGEPVMILNERAENNVDFW